MDRRPLDAAGARLYVAERYGLPLTQVRTTSLAGGISNDVVLVETPSERFVLKQALGQLRVQEPWFSDRERILREAAVLQKLAPLLPEGAVPRVLFVDPSQYCYAMTAAPAGAAMWKISLMRGEVSPAVAAAIGRAHGALLQLTWNGEEWAREFGDQRPFEQLRLEPYYEFTARKFRDLEPKFTAAANRCRTQRVALVHGDWSPKNMMVSGGGDVMVIDFEVIHFGDPSFDIAFLWNHLVLKSFIQPAARVGYGTAAQQYWQELAAALPDQDSAYLAGGALQQLPLLMLARMDGKSPVEYIKEDALRHDIRQFANSLLQEPPGHIREVWERLPV